jgi:tRNA(Ile)-lysidine synthase
LQAKARKIRYAFFDEISNSFPNSLICTAHHADDQVETFFLQLSRGAGMKGMAGMATLDQNRLRPFLNFSKQDLFRAANEVQLNWREDRSNQSLAYRRNVWRNQFLPELTELVPDLKNSVLQIQSTFQSEIKSQHKKLNFAIEQLKINQSITLKEIALLSVYQFIELFKYFQIPGHVIQRIPELFKAENGKKLTWNDLESKAYALLIFEKKLWYIRHHTVNEKQSCPFYFELEKVRQLPQTYHLEDIYLDTQLLEGALQLKPLKKADHLYPMGLKGKKNAFEILKEHKIPDLLRPMFWGLFDQDKLILMPGIKLDRRALATANSKEILKVSLYKKT